MLAFRKQVSGDFWLSEFGNMGISSKILFYMILLIVLALVPALYATRTFNTAVYNGQRYTAPTTTPKSTNNLNAAAAQAAAARRHHPPPATVQNRYSPAAAQQRPLYKPPTTTPAPKKCKCDCGIGWQPVCAKDDTINDMDTFPTKCALDCYNCTHDRHYVVISYSQCK